MMPDPIEYDCEGCGFHVYSYSPTGQVPPSHWCAECAWLCEFMPDPEKMMIWRKKHAEYNILPWPEKRK